MKVVGRLAAWPSIAIASTLHASAGSGEAVIQQELDLLNAVAAEGIRTIGFSPRVLTVPSYERGGSAACSAYLLQYFSLDDAFVYEEGETGTPDHFIEPMRKLRILDGDEGDWTMNRDTLRILREYSLEEPFMEDLRAYVKLLLEKGLRINDYQGVLGIDGHFYVADPLHLEPVGRKVNRHLLQGVFMTSAHPKRENKASKAAFVEGLGLDLGLAVVDEDESEP